MALVSLFVALPSNFPKHLDRTPKPLSARSAVFKQHLRRVDAIGAGLLISASLLLVTALNEAGVRFSWASGATISLLVLSGLCWVAFPAWEKLVSGDGFKAEPVFPWRFVHNRAWLGILLTSFCAGISFNVVVVDLPQRFQAVDGTTPLQAGIRLLPYTFVSPLCSIVANVVASKSKLPLAYLLFVGASLQLIGLSLLSTVSSSTAFPASGYGYEAIAGAGIGITFSILVLSTPFAVEPRDLAVATGAVIQFRFLGGAIGLAITSTVLNSRLKTDLSGLLSPSQLSSLLQSTEIIDSFDSPTQVRVREAFAGAYATNFKIVLGFAAAQFLTVVLILKRNQIKTP